MKFDELKTHLRVTRNSLRNNRQPRQVVTWTIALMVGIPVASGFHSDQFPRKEIGQRDYLPHAHHKSSTDFHLDKGWYVEKTLGALVPPHDYRDYTSKICLPAFIAKEFRWLHSRRMVEVYSPTPHMIKTFMECASHSVWSPSKVSKSTKNVTHGRIILRVTSTAGGNPISTKVKGCILVKP